MNRNILVTVTMSALMGLMLASTGCHRKPTPLAYIPGQTRAIENKGDDQTPRVPNKKSKPDKVAQTNPPAQPPKVSDVPPTGTEIPMNSRPDLDKFDPDREALKAQTVYFDFDRYSVRKSERPKLEKVAEALKKEPKNSVLVEGYCDERGTEEYNRSLGERRALAVREYLVMLGISPERVFTMTFGKDRPVELGHNEAAWSKNRRGEFVLLIPKTK